MKLAIEPPGTWQEKATLFIEWCHAQLWTSPTALEALCKRGFTNESIKNFKLGYCPKDVWRPYTE